MHREEFCHVYFVSLTAYLLERGGYSQSGALGGDAVGIILGGPIMKAIDSYPAFLEMKSQCGADVGFEPVFMPSMLKDFQASLVDWAIRKGRAAIFADCGLGKTLMELVWAQNIHEFTNRGVLVVTPLAVGHQTEREGQKFGIPCRVSRDGAVGPGITITNYERLQYFNPNDFGGVVCDESSILKSFNGQIKSAITQFMIKIPYRLLATATAAPNDFIELGTSSEALGYLGFMDMLQRFFKNDQNSCGTKNYYGEAPKWRFKGHAERPFWRWVCSWARACRRPSDLGFRNDEFLLPPLTERHHIIKSRTLADGMLFDLPASTLREQREERRRTVGERCEAAASLAAHNRPAIIWCHLNEESDLLEKTVPGAIQVSGKDSNQRKEEKFAAFGAGEVRCLVTKPKIGAWGLNWQHAADIVYFPSHSYESYYQAIRRCWRFGQTRPVNVDLVLTEGELKIMENLKRKSLQASDMFARLVEEMNEELGIQRRSPSCLVEEIPSWL